MTWAGLVGICTALANVLAYVTNALPHNYARWAFFAGIGLTAIDRLATSFENMSIGAKTKTLRATGSTKKVA